MICRGTEVQRHLHGRQLVWAVRLHGVRTVTSGVAELKTSPPFM